MLTEPNGKSSQESMIDCRASLNLAGGGVVVMSGGYSHLFYSPFSTGCWAQGWETIIAVGLAFPGFVGYWPPVDELGARMATLGWAAMLILLPVRGLINRRPWNPNPPNEIGVPIFGRIGNIILPLAVGYFSFPHCAGITWYIASGWAANWIHLILIGARYTRQARLAEAKMREAEMLQWAMRKRGKL